MPSLRLPTVNSRIEISSGGKNRNLELFTLPMQTKNTIKQIILLLVALFVAEGVFGFGLFWPFLLVLRDKKGIFWISFFCGMLLSVIYTQKIGLMSLYIVFVVSLVYLFANDSKTFGKWLFLVSVLLGLLFDFLFGLHWSVAEGVLLGVTGLWVSRSFEFSETIKLNY